MGEAIGALIGAALLVWFVYVVLKDAESQPSTFGKVVLVGFVVVAVAGLFFAIARR